MPISIHAPREGGDPAIVKVWNLAVKISIHAPREGGDDEIIANAAQYFISIHAPREGGDCLRTWGHLANKKFQSTPPARGATKQSYLSKPVNSNFNPRPPRGGRLI